MFVLTGPWSVVFFFILYFLLLLFLLLLFCCYDYFFSIILLLLFFLCQLTSNQGDNLLSVQGLYIFRIVALVGERATHQFSLPFQCPQLEVITSVTQWGGLDLRYLNALQEQSLSLCHCSR